ncbi:MAG: glycerol-3-phosphate 1-O-acyltransferase PlsY [Candidatus Kapaibacteriales bacterium]
MFYVIFLIVISYLLGSFPTGLIVGKIFFGIDIRKLGSGNIGSTNVFRVLGSKWGIFVQVIDILKGFLPVFFLSQYFITLIEVNLLQKLGGEIGVKIISGFSAIIGHILSVFTKFNGGKGVNTTLGMLLAIAPVEVIIALMIFLLTFLSSGIVAVGSIVAGISFPIIVFLRMYLFHYPYQNFFLLFLLSLVLAIITIFTHRQNIKRIINGSENKFEKFHIIKFKKNESE